MWVMRELQSWSPRGCLLQCPVLELAMRRSRAPLMRQSEGIRPVLSPSGRAHGGFKAPQARCSLHFPRQPCTGKGEIFNNLVIPVSYTHLTLPTIYSV